MLLEMQTSAKKRVEDADGRGVATRAATRCVLVSYTGIPGLI